MPINHKTRLTDCRTTTRPLGGEGEGEEGRLRMKVRVGLSVKRGGGGGSPNKRNVSIWKGLCQG
jgi:hypothetical protein